MKTQNTKAVFFIILINFCEIAFSSWKSGLCQGKLIKLIPKVNQYECLKRCVESTQHCHWVSYYKTGKISLLEKNIPFFHFFSFSILINFSDRVCYLHKSCKYKYDTSMFKNYTYANKKDILNPSNFLLKKPKFLLTFSNTEMKIIFR